MLPDTLLEPSPRPRRFVVDALDADGRPIRQLRRIHFALSHVDAAFCFEHRRMGSFRPRNFVLRVALLPYNPEVPDVDNSQMWELDWVPEGWAELPVLFVVHGPHLVVLGGAP